jgi:hypothetical protein
MTQNICDDEDFFWEYSRLPRSVAGLDAAPEWPALQALLPDLDGLRVVDKRSWQTAGSKRAFYDHQCDGPAA